MRKIEPIITVHDIFKKFLDSTSLQQSKHHLKIVTAGHRECQGNPSECSCEELHVWPSWFVSVVLVVVNNNNIAITNLIAKANHEQMINDVIAPNQHYRNKPRRPNMKLFTTAF